MDDIESILSRLVRCGKVTDVDAGKRRARVWYDDERTSSGWLRVLANPPCVMKVDGSQQAAVIPWLPRVNDVVLVVYLPADDSDGYILGCV